MQIMNHHVQFSQSQLIAYLFVLLRITSIQLQRQCPLFCPNATGFIIIQVASCVFPFRPMPNITIFLAAYELMSWFVRLSVRSLVFLPKGQVKPNSSHLRVLRIKELLGNLFDYCLNSGNSGCCSQSTDPSFALSLPVARPKSYEPRL